MIRNVKAHRVHSQTLQSIVRDGRLYTRSVLSSNLAFYHHLTQFFYTLTEDRIQFTKIDIYHFSCSRLYLPRQPLNLVLLSAKMATQDPIERYNTLLASNEFLFIVCKYFLHPQVESCSRFQDYRGHWCPFCRAFLTTLQSLAPAITAARGKAVTITSEPLEYLDTMRKSTGWDGEGISDPENKLVQYFKERDMVNVAISTALGATGGRTYYAHGMAQPAILAVRKNGEVLEKWAIVPSLVSICDDDGVLASADENR